MAATCRSDPHLPREVWERRLERDACRMSRQPTAVQAITGELLARAIASGAASFALTGSTALARRTAVSDLDYYIIGERPSLPDVDEEVDVYAIDRPRFLACLAAGDDYLHWTLRFGLVLHDAGPLRWAYETTVRHKLTPDPALKAQQARSALDMAAAILGTGDHAASVEQCRIAFSLVARWWLLACGDFPRARSDLPEQLRGSGLSWLGDALSTTILGEPPFHELSIAVERSRNVLTDPHGPPMSASAYDPEHAVHLA